jgi:hypothetical protein
VRNVERPSAAAGGSIIQDCLFPWIRQRPRKHGRLTRVKLKSSYEGIDRSDSDGIQPAYCRKCRHSRVGGSMSLNFIHNLGQKHDTVCSHAQQFKPSCMRKHYHR